MMCGEMELPVENIALKTGNYVSLLFEYNAIHTALRAVINQLPGNPVENANTQNDTTLKTMTAKQYRDLITKDKACTPCSQLFWQNRYQYEINENHWKAPSLSTKEERLRLLQWKILHNIYPTNILLQKMKLRDNNRCSLCHEIDFIEHFFWRCKKLQLFWDNVKQTIFLKTDLQISLDEQAVLFGYKVDQMKLKHNKTVNHILLIAKMCISKYRYGVKVDPICIFNNEVELRHVN